jgi:iron complex transport system ATP-binding protein
VTTAAPALRLAGVGVTRDGRDLLDGVDLAVAADDRWVVLGPNGSGKTTLLRIASLALAPTRGTVEVLGQRLGAVDVRPLRARIGLASAAVADAVRPTITAEELVASARSGALEPWWHPARADDRDVARSELARLDADHLAERTFGTLSSGERQRVLVARSLVARPGLLLLDEPTAGLDLGARERLVTGLGRLAADPATPPMVFVTHHVEEIPPGATSLLLLRGGRVLAAGDLTATLTDEALSDAFGLPLRVRRRRGRWSATATSRVGGGSTT